MLTVEDVGMRFGRRWVLESVSLSFAPGQVHGLVGHNGSGKSTLVKIIAGYHTPTTGSVSLDSDRVDGVGPAAIRNLGIRFVHQDLGLVQDFNAIENFGLGGSYSKYGPRMIDWRVQSERLRRMLNLFSAHLPLDVPVRELSAVQRSLIAIARAVEEFGDRQATRFLVLDEPTTALEGPEVEQLFGVVRQLCRSGIGVVFVSHNLNDVLALSSHISVMRDGHCVGTFASEMMDHDRLVNAVLGEAATHARTADGTAHVPSNVPVRKRAAERESKAPVLSVRGLRSELLNGIDIDLFPGECVCVMGLSGSGREQLNYALAGAVASRAQSVEVGGNRIPCLSPQTCREHRVALAPGNRMTGSLISKFSVRENMSLASLDKYRGRAGSVRRKLEAAETERWIQRFEIRPNDLDYVTGNLSGGNKQKLILAKWMGTDPLVFLIDEPTAGVDVGAAAKIYSVLRDFADEGRAVLITTSEVDDALAIADRVLFLYHGRVSHETTDTGGLTDRVLMLAMNQPTN